MSDCPPLNPGCGSRQEARTASRSPGPESGYRRWRPLDLPDWPTVMHVPLLRGRAFDRHDDKHSRRSPRQRDGRAAHLARAGSDWATALEDGRPR